LENLGVDGRIILKVIFRKRNEGMEGMHWIGLAQDRYRRSALLNFLTKRCVPQNSGEFLN
jgi:hypothetical protein